jgi:hypothetical protein
MEDDIPLPPDTGWGTEMRQLMKDRGHDFDQACDRVLLGYLIQGDPRPLLDLLKHRKTPGSGVLRYLAAMIDPEFRARLPKGPFLFEIRFEERRKRGRPESHKSGIHFADFREVLKADTTAMVEGRQPDDGFWKFLWHCLSSTLEPERYLKAFGKDFPFRAKLARTDGSKGRHQNPELGMRDRGLAWFVSEAIAQGKKYDAALDEVAGLNNISREIVRNAYSKYGNQ